MTELAQTPEGAPKDQTKLTDWENPPKLTDLKQDLQDARQAHSSQVMKVTEWLDNLNVTGKAKIKTPDGHSAIVPKLIRKQAEWRYAALSEPFLSRKDIFKVEPVSWEDRDRAKQNQLLLNNQFNTKINKVRFIDKFVRTAVDEGTVILRTGWRREEEEYKAMEPIVQFEIDLNFGATHQELAQLKIDSPSQYALEVPEELRTAHDMTVEGGQPIRPVVLGEREVTKVRVIRNHPTVEVCNFRNVIIDPTCEGNLDEARFVVMSFESSKSELRKDKKYKNLEHVRASDNGPLSQPDHAVAKDAQSFNFADEPRKRITVYEYWGYWDVDGTGVVKPFVCAWVGDVIIRLEESPYPDGKLPFVNEHYLPVRDSNYGEPDGVLIEDNQKIAGAVTRGMVDIMGRSANGQTGIRRGLLDTTNRRKFDKGMDYEFNGTDDPRMGIHMHTYPEIPQSAPFMLQLQHQEAESITGVKSFSNGISGESLGDVAVSVRGALDAASKRELGILRRLSNAMTGVARKFVSMNAVFLEPEEVIRVTNKEFVTVNRDDLAGNYDIELSISTAEEDEKKAGEMAFMLQTMGPNQDPGLSRMILADIATLRKMPDLAHKIESYEPQPDPLAQKMQELEIAKLEAEIAEIRAKTQEKLVNAGLIDAKIDTEAAKAENLRSDTDMKDLGFVEQESGVTQERELEKQGAQAAANLRTELVKGYIKQKEAKKAASSK